MTFDVNTIKGIEGLHNHVQSKGNSLKLRKLKSLLDLTRSSACHSSKIICLQQLKGTEERLQKLIKEKTPWFRTQPFYITISAGVLVTILGYAIDLQESKPQASNIEEKSSKQPLINNQNSTLNRVAGGI